MKKEIQNSSPCKTDIYYNKLSDIKVATRTSAYCIPENFNRFIKCSKAIH